MYVSLEPCSHQGRTPPCADRLIAEGVDKVVIGALDPDPKVSGSGIRRLKEAGVEVQLIGDPEAEEVDPGYFHQRRTGRPMVIAKYAMTLDGSVAAADRTSQWITGNEARMDAHRLRSEVDGVVVGAGTLLHDDPMLDVRSVEYEGPQPRPVVVAGTTPLPEDRRIWQRGPVVISTEDIAIPAGDLVVVGGDGVPDPVEASGALAGLGMLSVLLEGGPTLMASWWRAGVISRGVVYLGGRFGGGSGIPPMTGVFGTIEDAVAVRLTSVTRIGDDAKVTYVVEA